MVLSSAILTSSHLNFGRLIPELPSLAVSEDETAFIGGPGGLMHNSDGRSPDSKIPAGYACFAQFVDHDAILDVTLGLRDNARISDTTPTADDIRTFDDAHTPKIDKVEDLSNLRSVSLDLDSVYGFSVARRAHTSTMTIT